MPYHDKSSLSQNFIKFPSLVRELLDSAEISRNDVVIEIGPGKGVITKQLSQRVKEVIAIEKDEALADGVRKYQLPNVKVIFGDFLEYQLPYLPYKIVANIPFSITAEIINKILTAANMPEAMYLIMQKEAAEKFAGVPWQTQSSLLTLPWYEIKILGEIDRTNFVNKPQVKIVFVEFKRRKVAFIKDDDRSDFRNFVIYGFHQWKGTVLEAFKKVFTHTQLVTIKKSLKIGEEKPSELSFDKWLLLFKTFARLANDSQRSLIKRVKT